MTTQETDSSVMNILILSSLYAQSGNTEGLSYFQDQWAADQ